MPALISHLEVTHITSAHILWAKADLAAILHFQWAAEGRQQNAATERAGIFVNSTSDRIKLLQLDEHVAA